MSVPARPMAAGLLTVAISGVVALGPAAPAHADVTVFANATTANTANCDTTPCTLQGALNFAATQPGAVTVSVAPGVYDPTTVAGGFDVPATFAGTSLTIQGSGTPTTVLHTGDDGSGGGWGIRVETEAPVTVRDVEVTTVAVPTSAGVGAEVGIWAIAGPLTVTGSTVAHLLDSGGIAFGIAQSGPAALTVFNSTVTDVHAPGNVLVAGVLSYGATAALTHVTITDATNGVVAVAATLTASLLDNPQNCAGTGTYIDGGGNVASADGGSCPFGSTSDPAHVFGPDDLGGLQNNGGPTPIRATGHLGAPTSPSGRLGRSVWCRHHSPGLPEVSYSTSE